MKLSIANTTIGQDSAGRYSLADLHRAAGSLDKHRPTYWLKNKKTQETIAFLESELEDGIPSSNFKPINIVKGYGITATYVAWELVYDYGMWVSPAFRIKVIRAFHALQMRPRLQSEKHLIGKHPFYPDLRAQVLDGKKDTEIAPLLGRSAGSVRHHRNKQFNTGFTDPLEYAHKRYAPRTAQKVIAKNDWDSWGSDAVSPQTDFEFQFSP